MGVPVARKKCKTCQKNRQLKFFTGPKGTVCKTCQNKTRRATNNAHHVKKTYGLTREELESLYEAQDGRCGICQKPRKVLEVDHDHKTERESDTRSSVRGLLCRRCNGHLLPSCLDDIEVLLSAVSYLLDPPAKKVLDGVA